MATASAEEIESIVREVMARMATGPVGTAAPPSSVAASHVAIAPPSAVAGDVVVDCRVVTLESIAGRLDGAKQLLTPAGALVTPAVRDELRRKGIGLIRGSAAASNRKDLARVLLVVGRTRHDPAAAIASLAKEGIDVQTETTDCMIAATDKLAAEVAAGRSLGVLWTRHTAAGLCLANRHAGVRAVLAAGVAATAAAVAAVGANVLVVDPAVGTAYEKKQVLRDFCLGGIRSCPEAFKIRLN